MVNNPFINPLVPGRVGIAGDTFLPAATDYWIGGFKPFEKYARQNGSFFQLIIN